MDLVILVDVDGVVADLCSEWLAMYNKDYDDSVTPHDITRWATHEFVKPECGDKIYNYLWLDELYDNVKPIAGSQEGVAQLRAMGHRVVFLTSGIQPAKIRWLHRHGFLTAEMWQQEKDVIIAHDKSLIRGDVLIDDGPHNFEGFNGIRILFNQPWNQGARIPRVRGWRGVVKWFGR